MKILKVTVNKFEDILPHLEYPCSIKVKVTFPKTKYEESKTKEIGFAEWEGAWLFQSVKYIELDDDWKSTIFYYLNNKRLINKEVIISIPDEDEYVKIVQNNKGIMVDNIKDDNPKIILASEEYIRNYYKEIKTKQIL